MQSQTFNFLRIFQFFLKIRKNLEVWLCKICRWHQPVPTRVLNPKHAGSRGAVPVGGMGGEPPYQFYFLIVNEKIVFKETKKIFLVCPSGPPTGAAPLDSACFWIEEMRTLIRTGSWSTAFKEFSAAVFFCITQKKIGKIWNLVLLFIQPIAVLSCKFYHFWKKKYFFLDFDCMHSIKKISQKWSNLHVRTTIGWIKKLKPSFRFFQFLFLSYSHFW